MLTEKTRFLKRSKNASALLSSTCVFKYLKNQRFIRIPERPARRLIFLLSCWLSDTYIWTGQHLNCIFRAFCTFCTLMSRIISQEYSFLLKEARSFCKNIHLRNKICLHPIFNFIGFYSIWSTIWSTFCQTIFSIVASHSLEGK